MHAQIIWISIIAILISGSVGWTQLTHRRALLAPMQEETLTLSPELERKQKQWLKEQLAPQPGDEQIIAIVGDEEVPHGLVRSQAIVYQDGIPMLSPQEAYDKALVAVLMSKAQRLKAREQGLEVSQARVAAVREHNRTLCAQSPECQALIEAFIENHGMTEEEYWDLVPYESAMLSGKAVGQALEAEGPGPDATPEEEMRFTQNWSLKLLKQTPIEWFDPELEERFAREVQVFKPLIFDDKRRTQALLRKAAKEKRERERELRRPRRQSVE